MVNGFGFDWDYFVPVKLGIGITYLAPKGIEVGDKVDVTMMFKSGHVRRLTDRTVTDVGVDSYRDLPLRVVDAARKPMKLTQRDVVTLRSITNQLGEDAMYEHMVRQINHIANKIEQEVKS